MTVTLQESSFVGSACDLAVTDTVPAVTPVTVHSRPVPPEMLTMPEADVDHVTFLFEALSG